MNRGSNVASGNQEEVAKEDEYVKKCEVIGPANGDLKFAIPSDEISTKNESACNKKR
jgi:hypothetical protein